MLSFRTFLREFPSIEMDSFSQRFILDGGRNRQTTDPEFAKRIQKQGNDDFPTKTADIGMIGPYSIRIKSFKSGTLPMHTAVIHHEGVPVGSMSFHRFEKPMTDGKPHQAPYLRVTGIPRILSSHTGRKGKVPNLAALVYSAVSNHFQLPLISDSTHSPGAKNLWTNLSKIGKVSALHSRTGETIDNYDPEKHDETVYRGNQAHNWLLVHHPKQ